MHIPDLLKHQAVVFFFTFITIFFFFPRFTPFTPSWDTIPTTLLPLSLLNERDFDFDEFVQGQRKKETLATFGPAQDNLDYYLSLNKYQETVANFPVFPGILITPIYWLWSLVNPNFLHINDFMTAELWNLAYFISTLFTALTATVIFTIVHSQTKKPLVAFILTFIFVFGTGVIHTGAKFPWQHTFALLFLSLTLHSYLHKKIGLTVLFSTLVFLCRPNAILLCLPLLVALGLKLWNHPKQTKFSVKDLVIILISYCLVLFQVWYAFRYLDGSTLFALQYNASRFNGIFWDGFLGILLSPGRGLLFFTPLFFFSFAHWFSPKTLKKSPEFAIGIALYLILMAKWLFWTGGWSLGYRMVIELVPFLIFGLCELLQDFKPRYNLTTFLLVTSVMMSILLNTQILANFGDCGYNLQPESIDLFLPFENTGRLWLDSPLLRCVSEFQSL